MTTIFRFKKILLGGLLSMASLYSSGQNQLITDSLKEVVTSRKDIPDTLLFELLWEITDNETIPQELLVYSNKLLTTSRRLGDSLGIGKAYEMLHFSQRDLGNLEEANRLYLKALEYFRKLGRNDFLAASYAQEASLLAAEQQYQRSVEEYQKSLQTYRTLKDTLMTNIIRVNLGEVFRLFEKYDSSSYYLTQAIINNSEKNEIVESYASGNLGMVYFAQQKYDSAKALLETSISILEPLGDVYSMAVYTFELGKVLINQGQQARGKSKLLEAYEDALANGLKEQVRDFSEYLSGYYQRQGAFEKAFYYQGNYQVYKDSLINVENVRNVEQLRSRYKVSQKQAEIEFLNELNKSQQNTLWAVGSGSVVLIILLGLLYRNNQQRRKINIALTQREKEKALLLSELNHRTKNNLNMISSLLNLQSADLGDHVAAEALLHGRYRVDSLALIHQKLYKEDYAHIDMQPYLTELFENLVESFDPDVQLTSDILPVKMNVEQAIPLALIINELLTNSLKYCKVEEDNSGWNPEWRPVLHVSLQADEFHYILSVNDNGPGMEPPNVEDLSSFGLKLIYSLTDQLNGAVDFKNKNGVQWTITFPQ